MLLCCKTLHAALLHAALLHAALLHAAFNVHVHVLVLKKIGLC